MSNHHHPLDRVGASGGYVINGVLAKGCLIVGLRDLKTYHEVILVLFFPVYKELFSKNYKQLMMHNSIKTNIYALLNFIDQIF